MNKKIYINKEQYDLIVKLRDWYKINYENKCSDRNVSRICKNINDRLTNRKYDDGFELDDSCTNGLRIIAQTFIDDFNDVKKLINYVDSRGTNNGNTNLN